LIKRTREGIIRTKRIGARKGENGIKLKYQIFYLVAGKGRGRPPRKIKDEQCALCKLDKFDGDFFSSLTLFLLGGG